MKHDKSRAVPEQKERQRRIVRLDDSHRHNLSYYSRPKNDSEKPLDERTRTQKSSGTSGTVRKKRGLIYWIGIAVLTTVIGLFMMLGTNPEVIVLDAKGDVQQKDVTRYEKTISEVIESSLLNRNKITFDVRGIAKKLEKEHPEIQTAVVTASVTSNRPIVYVTQYSTQFILRQGSSRYGLTANGYVVDLPKISESLPVIIDDTGEEITIGKQLLPKAHVRFIETVVYELNHNSLRVANISLPAQKAYEINVSLKSKPYILRFNLAEDAIRQSGAAAAAIKTISPSTPQYIDVRVPGRVYFK